MILPYPSHFLTSSRTQAQITDSWVSNAVALALRSLLGLSQDTLPYIESLDMGDLAKIVYRDHVRIKHACRKRLAEEMEEKDNHEQNVMKDVQKKSDYPQEDSVKDRVDMVSHMLAKYLLQVGWFGTIW